METKSLKQYVGWATNLWDKYRTDLFFRTTCHIIILQVVLTIVVVVGLWFVMEYLVRDTSELLVGTFTDLIQGGTIAPDAITERLANVRTNQFWPTVIVATAVILCFGFIMVYVALTPTRRSLERKKRFISNIAHELRTPLAIIRTNTDVTLLDHSIPEKVSVSLKRNLVELDRISEIMNNLLSLSNFMRSEKLAFEDVDVSKVAQHAMDALMGTLGDTNISLTLKSHTEQKVIGNASALEQVVFNLVKNAIAHTPEGGSVTVTVDASEDNKEVHLSVSDTGSGIAKDDLFHIFEPFYRARTSSKKEGQGLGLAIVNEIVQIHRGKIKVQSAVGKGTTVTVALAKSTNGDTPQIEGVEEVTVDFTHRILS